MTPEQYRKVTTAFNKIRELPSDKRDLYISSLRASEPDIACEVEELLNHRDDLEIENLLKSKLNIADEILNDDPYLGEEFGNYRIVERVSSEGGMSDVFIAQHIRFPDLPEWKAIIKLLPNNVVEEDSIERFEREAKTLKILGNHKHIVQIIDFGVSEASCKYDNRFYIITEFISSPTLRQILQTRRLKILEVVGIALQIADALNFAHSQTPPVIHRDVKPENILYDSDKQSVHIIDFGIAKIVSESDDNNKLTKVGVLIGTTPYMSPEQLSGLDVDKRTDIWSFGIVLYELLTGKPPFSDDVSAEVKHAIHHKSLPPVTFDEDCPNAPRIKLQNIVNAALQKNKDERYRSISDMRRDLERVKELLQDKKISKPKAVALASVVLIIVASIFAYQFFYPAQHTYISGEGKIRHVVTVGEPVFAAISPSGKYIAYVSDNLNSNERVIRLYNTQAGSDNKVNLLQDKPNHECVSLRFSPNDDFIYGVCGKEGSDDNSLYRINLTDKAYKQIAEDVEEGITVSPDGLKVAFMRDSPHDYTELFVIDNDGANEQKLASRKFPDFFFLSALAWSPDGSTIAVAESSMSRSFWSKLVGIKIADGKVVSLFQSRWRVITDICWLSSDRVVISAISSDTASMQVYELSLSSNKVSRLTNGLDSYDKLQATADGNSYIATQSTIKSNIFLTPLDSNSKSIQITYGLLDGATGIAWTPNGGLIYTSFAEGEGKHQLRTFLYNGSDTDSAILSETARINTVDVSSDGRFIAYDSDKAGGFNIWITDTNTGESRPVTSGGFDFYPRFSPDSQFLYYTSLNKNAFYAMKVSVDGGSPLTVSDDAFSYLATPSPDGTRIAHYGEGKDLEILGEDGRFIKSLPGIPSNKFRNAFHWDSRGQAIDYIYEGDGRSNVARMWVDTKQHHFLTNFQSIKIFNFAVSPDEKWLAYSGGEVKSRIVLINLE